MNQTAPTYTTQAQVRKQFWIAASIDASDYKPSKTQNAYNATVRTAFVGFVDALARNGLISEALAQRVTL